jgi:hypothetical protein
MKDVIWLSPSLAAGAVAARFVGFFDRCQTHFRRGVERTASSRSTTFRTVSAGVAGHHNDRI